MTITTLKGAFIHISTYSFSGDVGRHNHGRKKKNDGYWLLEVAEPPSWPMAPMGKPKKKIKEFGPWGGSATPWTNPKFFLEGLTLGGGSATSQG